VSPVCGLPPNCWREYRWGLVEAGRVEGGGYIWAVLVLVLVLGSGLRALGSGHWIMKQSLEYQLLAEFSVAGPVSESGRVA